MKTLLLILLLIPANLFAGNVAVYEDAAQTVKNKEIYYPMQAEPTMPSANESVIWTSNGVGVGSQGDIVTIVNIGGTVKYSVLKKWNSAIASLPVYKEMPYVQWVDGTFMQMIDETLLEWVTAP